MEPTSLLNLLPEIIVAITGAVVLIVDLFSPVRPDTSPTRRPVPFTVAVAGLLAAAWATLALAPRFAAQPVTMFEGIIVLDSLGTFFNVLFLGIGVLVLLVSFDAVVTFSRWTAEFYALIVWCTLGHMLLASAGELFTIFLALQLTSLPLIVLVGYAKHDPRSSEASLKYLLLVMVSTAVLLYGMSLVYGSLGTSTISEIGAELAALDTIDPVVSLGLVLLLTGFGFKITAVPFHWWVPDVYEGAPTPVTAFLSVGSKFAGFALALRIIITGLKVPLDWHIIFGVLAALSMTLGNLGAMRQTSIKRMLAYSGIAQAGYLLIGIAALNEQGVAAMLFYAVAYALGNLAAFSVVITVSRSTGSDRITEYAGLARRSPLLALSLAVALLSLGGLPLMAGFMAKFYVFLPAVEAGLLWLVAIAVINSVMSLYYYLRVVWQMYVAEPLSTDRVLVPRAAGAALALCVAGVFALGVFPEPVLAAARTAASALFGG